jgi:hypothetical protein
MRRPFSFHEAQVVSGFGDSLHRPCSYQVLDTQIGTVPDSNAPVYDDRPNTLAVNIPRSPMPHMPRYVNPLEKAGTENKEGAEKRPFSFGKFDEEENGKETTQTPSHYSAQQQEDDS